MTVHASVALLTLRQIQTAKHKGPETEINFYKNAEAIGESCPSAYNPNSNSATCTTKQELDLDAFVVIE